MSLTDPVVTWLDKFLEAGIAAIKFGSTVMPRQTTLQFTGAGVSVSDDPINSQTVVTIAGGGGGGGGVTPPSGVGLWLNAVAGVLAAAASIGTAGQLPFTSAGGTAIGWASFSGDVSLSASTPGRATVTAINGASVPAAAGLVTGNVLQVSGASSLAYAAVNLAGGGNFVTGLLPASNQAPQSLTGDATGTTAAVVVTGIRGTSVPAPAGTGTALVWNAGSSGVLSWASVSGSSALTSYGADLTGDATHQWVQSISGAGGAGGGIAINAGTFTWGASQSPALSQGQQANGSNPANFVVNPQAPGAGAATSPTGTPGSFVVNLALPVSTGADGGIQVRRNGVVYGQLGPFVNAPTQAALYVGNGVVPSVADGTNHVIQVIGTANAYTDTIFNSASANSKMRLRIGGALAARGFILSTDGVQIGSETFSLGGGSGIIGIANRTAVPTSNPTGGVAVYAQAGQLWIYPSSGSPFQVSASGVAPTWTNHAVVLGSGSSTLNSVGMSAVGNAVLLCGGTTSDPVWSGFSLAAPLAASRILRTDGTNWINSAWTMAAPGTSGNLLTSDGTNWTSAPAGLSKTASGNTSGASVVNTTVTQVSTGIPITLLAGQKVWIDFTLELSNNLNSGEIITFGFGTSPSAFVDSYAHTMPIGGGGGPLAITYQTVHCRTGYNPGAGSYTFYGLAQAAIAANIVPVKCLMVVEVVSV